ncbi:hypothetical protein BJF86_00555 [Serinicoccus sp. CNJ-927]|nr:hypothetical protein BJF86_00555 [Serinicoccus sp. CNJ-927]
MLSTSATSSSLSASGPARSKLSTAACGTTWRQQVPPHVAQGRGPHEEHRVHLAHHRPGLRVEEVEADLLLVTAVSLRDVGLQDRSAHPCSLQ